MCRATFLWTPLLLIFYDERLRIGYYKSVKEKNKQKNPTADDETKNNKEAEKTIFLIDETNVREAPKKEKTRN